ncbi:hypothetical protein J19TS2_14490 [Cohnella xylanilytica]|uniref:hypothetical protein n=1 Tax=Cohnella xylanilytica TaxID=557555 RepID=UPI001B019FE6|nr:hypothetical protein [Cohnella xylanilytica]GIO11894.1 hypothetical protein J19TS2_14490 [Cohnella xylanilytica]
MAGHPAYILYTVLMGIALLIGGIALLGSRRNKVVFRVFVASLPVFLAVQCYYWIPDANRYAKGYLFPSRTYSCADAEELRDLVLPLPRRTVLTGKEDACSPNYATPWGIEAYRSFYKDELEALRSRGVIREYRYIEAKESGRTARWGYVAVLPSGSELEILLREAEGSGLMTIDYKENQGTPSA